FPGRSSPLVFVRSASRCGIGLVPAFQVACQIAERVARGAVPRPLAKCFVNLRHLADGDVQVDIRTRLISAQKPDIARILETGDHGTELAYENLLVLA